LPVPKRISVIIAVLNGQRYISAAIKSAMDQAGTGAVEIIVVDDGSTDRTAEIASGFPGVRVISTPNRGQSAARNTGIGEASGEYLVFLDHDDVLTPGSLRLNASLLDRHPEIGLVGGGILSFKSDDELSRLQAELPDMPDDADVTLRSYRELLCGNTFVPPAMCMFRREIVVRLGGFRKFAGGEDLDLYVRVGRDSAIGVHDYPCALYRRHGSNLSRNVALMLSSTLSVLDQIERESNGDRDDLAAIDAGRLYWTSLLLPHLPMKAFWAAKELRLREAAYSIAVWWRLKSSVQARQP
jgi:glycosyltransferase involved in cell wall biosynthesis